MGSGLHTLAGVVLLGQATGVQARLLGGVGDVQETDVRGELLADEGSHCDRFGLKIVVDESGTELLQSGMSSIYVELVRWLKSWG